MPIIAPERMLDAEGDFTWTRECFGEAFRRAHHALVDALGAPEVQRVLMLSGIPGSGKSTWAAAHDSPETIIWDACCLTRPARRSVLSTIRQAAIQAKRRAVPVGVVRFETPFDECMRRNSLRDSARRVPDGAMYRARRNFLAFPPQRIEGFAWVLRPVVEGAVQISADPPGP